MIPCISIFHDSPSMLKSKPPVESALSKNHNSLNHTLFFSFTVSVLTMDIGQLNFLISAKQLAWSFLVRRLVYPSEG